MDKIIERTVTKEGHLKLRIQHDDDSITEHELWDFEVNGKPIDINKTFLQSSEVKSDDNIAKKLLG